MSTVTKEVNSLPMDYDWTELPKHILDSVLEKLESSMDYLQFGCVCHSWRSVMLNDSQVKHKNTTHYHHVPVLLVPNINDQHVWRIYDVMANKFLNSTLSIPYEKRFCGSSLGWLVFVNNDWSVSLYNPFSNQHIRLPCLFAPNLEIERSIDITQIYDYHVMKAIITTDPLANPNKCLVIVIFEEFYQVAYIKLNQETKWTILNDESEPDAITEIIGEDIFQYKNEVYCVGQLGDLCSFDVTSSNINQTIDWVVPEPFTDTTDRKRYIVEVNGNLLQVERFYDYYGLPESERRDTLMFRIFQLDLIGERWVEIESLGDYSIFLGVNSSVSVKASNVMGCQRNCIYFTHDVDLVCRITSVVCDLGIYDVQSKELMFGLNIDSSSLHMMTTRPPLWLVPTFNIN